LSSSSDALHILQAPSTIEISTIVAKSTPASSSHVGLLLEVKVKFSKTMEVRLAEATRVAVLLSPAKMSSRLHALPNQMKAKSGGFWRGYFYFFMSLLIAATAVYGFSHTIDHNLIHRSPLPPFVLYIHAIVFPAWIVFFIVQSALIRSHNVHLHRSLGWFGVGLAVASIIVGALTAISMARFEQQDPFNSAAFLIVQVMDLSSFAVPFALAIYWRKRPEFHRRLVLIASCALLDAAFGRFPALPLVFSPAGVDALICLGVIRDLIVDRRVHKVYLYALPMLIVWQIVAVETFVHASSWWTNIAHSILR
jgi:hypothetical protein